MSRPIVIGALFAATLVAAGAYLLLQVSAAPMKHDVSVTPSMVGPTKVASSDPAQSQPAIPHPAVRSSGSATAGTNPAIPEATTDEADEKPAIDVMRLPDTDPRLTATAAFDEANKAYDRGDYESARAIASKLLTKNPNNTRLMRIVVSTGCMTGDTSESVASTYRALPAADREQMRVRCDRYNIHFNDAPK
jgi:hypothetical protein